MFEWIFSLESWLALATLTFLEIALGIDNIIFISIMAGKLPYEQRAKARIIGLALAMFTRICLLLSLAFIMKLTKPLFVIFSHEISGRDIILISGGLFLLMKSSLEIHEKLENIEKPLRIKSSGTFNTVVAQIMLLDIIFSLDSVITAVGMAREIPIMVIAIVLAVIFMMFASGSISDFLDKHPTIKILALSFLILIGVALIGEGLDFHIPKGYIYFSMAFSFCVEMINMRLRKSLSPLNVIKEHIEKNNVNK